MNELYEIEIDILNDLNNYLKDKGYDIVVSLDEGLDAVKFPTVTMDIFNIADGLKTSTKKMYSQTYYFTIAIYDIGDGRMGRNRELAQVISEYFWSIGFRRSHSISIPNLKDKSIARHQLRFTGNITKDKQVY